MIGLPPVYGMLGIAALAALGVAYVDQAAAGRVEAVRLAKAATATQESLEAVRRETAAAERAVAPEIVALETAAEEIPRDVEVLDEYCRPGCRIRWPAD